MSADNSSRVPHNRPGVGPRQGLTQARGQSQNPSRSQTISESELQVVCRPQHSARDRLACLGGGAWGEAACVPGAPAPDDELVHEADPDLHQSPSQVEVELRV